MSRCIRKPTICIGENKGADQLCSNREADQSLCFRYCDTDSTVPLLPKPEISRLWPASVIVQPGLCRTRSESHIFFTSHAKAQIMNLLKKQLAHRIDRRHCRLHNSRTIICINTGALIEIL